MNLDRVKIRAISADETRDVLKRGLPAEESIYSGDENPLSLHLGAFLDDRLVGVATFLPEPFPFQGGDRDWRLRGMATREDVRGQGIGGLLLARGIQEVGDRQGSLLWCNGRVTARRFYERYGLRVVGEEFELPGTGPHYLFLIELSAGQGGNTAKDAG